ncbi:ModD protein [Denitratisoma sp. agr-D3]
MRSSLDDATLHALLRDDAPHGDLTTSQLGIGAKPGRAFFYARQPMRVCATEEASRLFQLTGATSEVKRASGTFATEGTELLQAEGSAAALHLAWKVAQTLVEYASGIATTAAAIVGALHEAGWAVPVACTRKNFPGTKAVAVKAVLSGGAVMHRLGLSETLLVFPEHLAFLPEPERAAALDGLARHCPEKKRVVEVNSLEDALMAARCGVEVLQLEKFTPAQVAQCKAALAAEGLSPKLAAAGGIHAANAVTYAQAGADLLVTSAPFFSRPADVQVRIFPA